jgi:hemerythrin-like metal-binding protein
MPWINWDDAHATGHAGMDQGHKQLVGLINQLADAMQNNLPRESCSSTLDQFIQHLKTHFQAEEELMDRHHYAKAKEHKSLHAMLVKDVLAFKESYDAGHTSQFITLLVILDSWLERDINGADKALADFLAARG